MFQGKIRGLFFGVVIGVGCFFVSDQASNYNVNLNKYSAERPIRNLIADTSSVDFSSDTPVVLGAQNSIATPSPELKVVDKDNSLMIK